MPFCGSNCLVGLSLFAVLFFVANLPAQITAQPNKGPVPPTPKGPVAPTAKGPVAPTAKGPVAPGVKTPVATKGPVAPAAPKTPAAPPPTKQGPKLPEPDDVSLDTRDGFAVKATYYA